MSHWSPLLESLHSAMLDELNARTPNLKPVLGMPVRQKGWVPPFRGIGVLLVPTTFDDIEQSGLVVLAVDVFEGQTPPGELISLWEGVVKRADKNFKRRRVTPRLGEPVVIQCEDPIPSPMRTPDRVIWVPFQIESTNIFLGIAV